MSIFNVKNKEELMKKLDEVDQYLAEEDKLQEERERDSRRKAWISWLASGCLHATILMIFMTIIYVSHDNQDIESPPVRISMIPDPIKHQDPKIDRTDLLENKVKVEIDNIINEKITDAVVSSIEMPEDIVATSEDDTFQEKGKRGREEAVSDSEMGGPGAFMVIGPGGGGAGIFGNRKKGGNNVTKAQMGPHGRGTDSAIDAALRWLNHHQSPDGSWNAVKYYLNCTEGLKCEPGIGAAGDADVAMTGYSLLCYLGVGYDHKTPNKYRKYVNNGISYLLRVQKPDGLLGERNYEHAVAAMALFEAYAMTNDITLTDPCKKALRVLLERQASSADAKDAAYVNGLGWDYVKPNPNRIDFSVSGWCIMALKSAYAAGFDVKSSMKDFDKLMIVAWQNSNANWKNITPYDKSVFPYTINATTSKVEKEHLSFVGGLCSVFLGHRTGDAMLDSMTNDVKVRWLDNKAYKNNLYALYYSSLLAFQTQTTWKAWRDEYVPYLLENQIKTEDCYNGTWKFPNQGFHGADTSHVLRHTYALLALEVAYRYACIGNAAKPH